MWPFPDSGSILLALAAACELSCCGLVAGTAGVLLLDADSGAFKGVGTGVICGVVSGVALFEAWAAAFFFLNSSSCKEQWRPLRCCSLCKRVQVIPSIQQSISLRASEGH
jgi:hypothetical protein